MQRSPIGNQFNQETMTRSRRILTAIKVTTVCIGFAAALAACATDITPSSATATPPSDPASAQATTPAAEATVTPTPAISTPAAPAPAPSTPVATKPATSPNAVATNPVAAAPIAAAPVPSYPVATPAQPNRGGPPAQILQAGDVIHLAFPGAPSLDTTQQIRRDGKLNLAMVGEIQAEGKTPADFEKELVGLYGPQLVTKEVKVTIVSSSFFVFVNGAVMKTGKIQPDHPITALDAVMEAGGFDRAKANPRSVRIIRKDGDKMKTITVDLQAILDGKSTEALYLQSGDIVVVPEKFQVF
jgi:polysaccharide biosynthesis/export protein